MTQNIDPIVLNFLYAFVGGLMTLFFMWLGCYVLGRLNCKFSIPVELAKGNVAV